MAEVTHEDWLAEAVRRFGDDPKKWSFECPFCGHVASAQDFLDAGARGDRAAVECIGRVVGAKGGMREGAERNADGSPARPCDWAAFGLFGNLGKGPIVLRDDGKKTSAFPFAETA